MAKLTEKQIQKKLKDRKEKVLKAAKKVQKKVRKDRLTTLSNRKIKELEIKQMSPEYKLKEDHSVGRPHKINPEMERVLFAYYTGGATLRSIHTRFGENMGFSYAALVNARDYYLWEDRCSAVRNIVMNNNTLNVADKFLNYMQLLDDMISDAIIRFTDNIKSGRVNSPFETLKIRDIKDLKDAISTFVELSHGGVRRHEIKQQIQQNVQISDNKAAKILEVLAEDDKKDGEK